MKPFHSLMTNTTSLVGYIAVLMFLGAYLGGDESYSLDPAVLKGSLHEYAKLDAKTLQGPPKSVIITIDGRQYEATIGGEVEDRPVFQY